MTDWLVDDQTTTRPSSHGEDGDSEGGWSSYPSYSQTTPKKLHVGLSDDRDRAAEVLVSETSRPVSSRTRSSENLRRELTTEVIVKLAEAAIPTSTRQRPDEARQ